MDYPMMARMAQLQSTIVLTATILPDGSVGAIQSEPGPVILIEPAKKTLSKWRFTGCPSSSVDCRTRLVFSFVLSGTCTESPRCPTEFQVDLPDHVTVTSQVYDKLITLKNQNRRGDT